LKNVASGASVVFNKPKRQKSLKAPKPPDNVIENSLKKKANALFGSTHIGTLLFPTGTIVYPNIDEPLANAPLLLLQFAVAAELKL